MSSSPARLSASDAVAALITVDGGYLLQLRDPIEGIYYPGHWGCFGGAVEPGESPEDALRREVTEELAYTPQTFSYFTKFQFDFAFAGMGDLWRIYYEVPLVGVSVDDLVLSEGSDLRVFKPDEVFAGPKLVPYDSFALWLHLNRRRIS